MDTRRNFLKKAALLSGTAAVINTLPPVIQRALAINPAPGSTFYDAEHIVFLMQENRSFDHQLGNLQGVRGYNDPRAIQLPTGNKVFLQTNQNGDTYGPFHLDVKDTKVAWMGALPHNWTDQTDAMNNGKYDRWLDVKKAHKPDYANIPLTMGYCDREDFPFYYSLADAFTVCDQNFCSSITGTHPNRHYWMTGTVREKNSPDGVAHLWNVNDYNNPTLNWTTFPERLEENGVSWKVYQNEISLGYGINTPGGEWLSNFGTNVLEYFKQYNVNLHAGALANLQAKKQNLQQMITDLSAKQDSESAARLIAVKRLLANIEKQEYDRATKDFNALNKQQQGINNNAFVTNINDPFYHDLTPLKYSDGGTERELNIPAGDVFHQFREDVKNGTLPAVSWLMPPANFSDHPGEPWFGPWYVSEAMEILLQNPEVWKKTIFVVTYDENDGYFDHVPPFVVPNPYKDNTGKVSAGIDPKMDFVTRDQQTNPSTQEKNIRESAIGLGYRVPMIIASPWTRGGFVCSEVFDHTSSIQFVEHFMDVKFGKKIKEENITEWRRTICGNLTSAFRPYNGERIVGPQFLQKAPFYEEIHQAQFKQVPNNYKKLSDADISQINKDRRQSTDFPQQEIGTRSACALPYELYTNAAFDPEKGTFNLAFKAGNSVFGKHSAGSPFKVYTINEYQGETMRTWDYSVAAGDALADEWKLSDFADQHYHLRVYGPNGFYREFTGDKQNPTIKITSTYERSRLTSKLTGNLLVSIANTGTQPVTVAINDNSYQTGSKKVTIAAGAQASQAFNLAETFNWYDLSVKVNGYDHFEERFAGRVETGAITKTDPLMGGVV